MLKRQCHETSMACFVIWGVDLDLNKAILHQRDTIVLKTVSFRPYYQKNLRLNISQLCTVVSWKLAKKIHLGFVFRLIQTSSNYCFLLAKGGLAYQLIYLWASKKVKENLLILFVKDCQVNLFKIQLSDYLFLF